MDSRSVGAHWAATTKAPEARRQESVKGGARAPFGLKAKKKKAVRRIRAIQPFRPAFLAGYKGDTLSRTAARNS
jgi:hypothetical protein